jgi:hypothetical protein
MKFVLPFALLAVVGLLTISFAASTPETPVTSFNSSDVAGIESAVLDYVEGIYDVQPERIERSVSKDLVKYGYWRASADEEYRGSAMTYEQLYKLAGSWNSDNKQNVTESTPKEIIVLDVLDKTATAKLTAHWGIDYFQLEKTGEKWMIRHVLWQAHP